MATPTDAAADAAELARESVGMPQLDPSTYANQLFWLVVALVVIWWILARVALPRIGAVLAERSGTISNDLAAAEELSLKVKEADAAYAKALAAARADAARIVAEAQAAIKADLAQATAEADARIAGRAAESEAAIAAIRASSEDAIRTVAREAAHEIATTLGAAEPPAGAIDALVDARMKG